MALHELADSGLRGAGRTAAGDATFVFYSALHGRPVVDATGKAIGRLDDLAVTLAESFPPVTALVVRRGRLESFPLTARWRDVDSTLREKAQHGVGELRRPLDRRQVPTALEHLDPRAGNALPVPLALTQRHEP